MMGTVNKYNGYTRYYSHTSEARKLEQPKRVVRKRRVRRRGTVFKYIGSKASISIFSVITITIFFAGLFSIVALSANITKSRTDIVSLNKDLKKIKEEYQLLNADISSSYDLAQIERIATTELGMSRPKSHQIVYVSVPKQSYIVQYRTEESAPQRNGVFGNLMGFVKDVLKLE